MPFDWVAQGMQSSPVKEEEDNIHRLDMGWSSGRRLSWTGASTYWATSALLSRLQPPVHSEDRRQQTGSWRSTLSGAALRRCQGRGVWKSYIASSWGELQHSQTGVSGTVLGCDKTVPSLPVWGSYFCCHHRPQPSHLRPDFCQVRCSGAPLDGRVGDLQLYRVVQARTTEQWRRCIISSPRPGSVLNCTCLADTRSLRCRMSGCSSKWHWWQGAPHCVHGCQLGCRAGEGPCLEHSLSTGEEGTEAYQGDPCSVCSWCPEVAERLVKTVPSWWHSLQEACWFRWSGTEAVVVPSAVSHCRVQAAPQWHGTPGAGQDHCTLPRSRLLAWNEQWCGQVDCPVSAMYLRQGSIITSVCSIGEHPHQSTNGDGCFGLPHPRRWTWWSRQCVGHDWPFHKVCHGCANNQPDC